VANIVLESSYPWQLKISLYSEIVAGDDQRAPELKLSMNKQTAKMTKLISIMDFMLRPAQGHYWNCINSWLPPCTGPHLIYKFSKSLYL
jgi:hypothetical protein